MNHSSRIKTAVLVLIVFAGCQGAKSPTTEKSDTPPPTPIVAPTVLQDGIPSTPEAAMRQMVEGLRNNQPEVIWQAMPERFQMDINGLIREFAEKMDPKLWEQTFTSGKKLVRLLKEKKVDILTHPALGHLTTAQYVQLKFNWDKLVELLTILIHSELGNLQDLQAFEMGGFLKQTGGRWLSQLATLSESLGQDSLSGMLQGLEPKVLKVTENTAQMAWVAQGSDKPMMTFALIKVGKRWIPAGWANAWEEIRKWRTTLRAQPADVFTRQSGEKRKTLSQMESVLDALLAAKTREEFHQTLDASLGANNVNELAAMIQTLSGAVETPIAVKPSTKTENPKTGPTSATEANSVTLLMIGAGPRDEDAIFDAVHAALPGDVDVRFEKTPNGLQVIVGPVGDFEQFQKKLGLGKITKMDSKTFTLSIEMKR